MINKKTYGIILVFIIFINPLTSADIQLPSLVITSPEESGLYINDHLLFNGIRITTILGIVRTIPIEAVASDENGIDRIEFSLDDDLEFVDHEPPYRWDLFQMNHIFMGKHILSVTAYNTQGQHITKKLDLRLYCLSI